MQGSDVQSVQFRPQFRSSITRLATRTLLLSGAILIVSTGCSVQDHKNGQGENVRLRTPLGGLDVRTNTVHGPDVGLPVYPGAVETGQHGNDSGSADINMNFGNWHLHVKAIGYHSADSEDKIVAFYKKAMDQYGDVLTCKNKVAIGQPTVTRQGLTCANDHEYDVTMKLDTSKNKINIQTPASHISGNVKLVAGSPENQHMVEFTPSPDGTKFALVVVQLPHKDQTD
ncbi:MAG: hypothetical protein WA708_12930 [Acidobacteriaceae bacterium]